MTGTAEDIADLIIQLGYGSIVPGSVNIFTGDLPPQPDNAIAVREIGGSKAVRSMGGIVADRPDVQVMVRRVTMSLLTETVLGIRGDGNGSGVDGFKGIIDGHEYYWVTLAYEPVYMGRDENNRRLVSMTFQIHRKR